MNPTIMVMTNKNWKESFQNLLLCFYDHGIFRPSGETFFWLLIPFFQLVTISLGLVQDFSFFEGHRQCKPNYSPYQNLFFICWRVEIGMEIIRSSQSPPSSEKTPITLKTLPLSRVLFLQDLHFDKVTLYPFYRLLATFLFFVNIFER